MWSFERKEENKTAVLPHRDDAHIPFPHFFYAL